MSWDVGFLIFDFFAREPDRNGVLSLSEWPCGRFGCEESVVPVGGEFDTTLLSV